MINIKDNKVPIAASQIKATATKDPAVSKTIAGEKASKTPPRVPMPLPPAKFKNKDQLWPMIAARPD